MRSLILFAAVFAVGSENAWANLRTVFLAPVPVVIEFDVTVDAGPVSDQRRKVAELLLEQHDVDDSGALSREEAAKLDPLPGDSGETVESLWDRVDTKPADDQLTVDEIHRLIDRVVGPEIRLDLETSQAIAVGPLETFLDANGDDFIEPDEFVAGFERLRRVDFDDDNSVSMAELMTYQRNLGNPVVVPPPFLAADDSELPAEIEKAWGRRGDARWQQRRWDEIDADANGEVSSAEAGAWIESAAADLVVRIDIAPITGNRMKVSTGEAQIRLVRAERQRGYTRATATVGPSGGSTALEFAVKKNFGGSDGTSFLKLQHIVADTDQNGYLSPGEYAAFDPKPGDYEAIDRNSDEMLTVQELEEFLSNVQRMAQLQVKVSVRNLTRSLFEAIDELQNLDNRLTPREILMASQERRRASYSSSTYQIDASTDVINFIPESDRQRMGDGTVNRPRAREYLKGPEWFQKMDRNRDGDLAWREFLGPREAFDRIDVNGDGYIVADEADAVE